MRHAMVTLFLVVAALAGCSTPYRSPVLVNGGPEFPGLIGVLDKSDSQAVDVILVHGMCTHDERWANEAIDMIIKAVDSNLQSTASEPALRSAGAQGIVPVTRTLSLGGGTVRFSALVWSPLTTPLKQQLDYDSTGEATDCSVAGECKPIRAVLNGKLKDVLMNDCLSDALIYQGVSRKSIRAQMMEAITQAVEQSEAKAREARAEPGPLILVSESLGSKLAFDALAEMIDSNTSGRQKAAGESAARRLALVFMGANQLPILGLADQDVGPPEQRLLLGAPAPEDSLQRVLRKRSEHTSRSAGVAGMSLIAFTDPNDLLSYRLRPSRYATPEIGVTDVLVSNDKTYFGFLERPDTAHKGYRTNPDVASLIACGHPRSRRCK